MSEDNASDAGSDENLSRSNPDGNRFNVRFVTFLGCETGTANRGDAVHDLVLLSLGVADGAVEILAFSQNDAARLLRSLAILEAQGTERNVAKHNRPSTRIRPARPNQRSTTPKPITTPLQIAQAKRQLSGPTAFDRCIANQPFLARYIDQQARDFCQTLMAKHRISARSASHFGSRLRSAMTAVLIAAKAC